MSEPDYPTMDSGSVPEAEVIWKVPVNQSKGITGPCPCGAEVDPDLIELRSFFPSLPMLCTACYTVSQREGEARDKRDQENAEHRHRLARLDATVPPEILATDLAYPSFNAPLYVAASGWDPASGSWLFIHGRPGFCKTRVVGLIVKRLILDGRRVVWATAGRLQELIEILGSGSFRNKEAADQELHEWKLAGILVLDDLGKNLWSPMLEARLFGIIDHRKSHYLPTILTANSSLADLLREMLVASKGDSNRSGPIIGRIKEKCVGWTFDAEKP